MDVAFICALSAPAGSVVGGVTSGLATWRNQRFQARAEKLAHESTRRQDLYKDLIVAALKTYAEALVISEPKIDEVIGLFAMISRMRVLSPPQMVSVLSESYWRRRAHTSNQTKL